MFAEALNLAKKSKVAIAFCVALAKNIGFAEVEKADVVQLLESHKEELSDLEQIQFHEELGLVRKNLLQTFLTKMHLHLI
jgi:hypothetical protein